LIAPFRSIDDDGITGIQRVRINQDGSKYDRRMLGVIRRAAIKVDLVGECLCIGEGLETVLAGRQFGYRPSWALGSVGAISFFPLIDSVKQLIIFGETGEPSANAIRLAGTRWHKAGCRVRVVMPEVGSDLNDILIAQQDGK
jgi:hypothetical protein